MTFGKRALKEQRDILKALYNRLDRPMGPSEEAPPQPGPTSALPRSTRLALFWAPGGACVVTLWEW